MNDINRYGRVRRHQNLLTHPSEIVSSVPAKVEVITTFQKPIHHQTGNNKTKMYERYK